MSDHCPLGYLFIFPMSVFPDRTFPCGRCQPERRGLLSCKVTAAFVGPTGQVAEGSDCDNLISFDN